MPDSAGAPAGEFDCRCCGRHIVVICGPVTGTCAECTWAPGWHEDPKLRALLDPGYKAEDRR